MVQNRFGRIPSSISAFIAVSDYSLSILRPLLPPSSRVFRVDNPIDIDRAAPSSILHNDTFTFVGRLSPEKGATMFAEASRLARVQAAFVGSGSEVEEISRLLGAGVLRGWQDRAGVIRSIQASRAIVFPSLWHETQGMVVSEAAALGVPAIVSDACAARDAVVDGETGLLFRAGDASDLARKLALLRDDHLLAPALGLEAYQRYWRAPSTYETHVKALVACYEKVLAG
jgi:glycosyltransferase involved in cell wall biosynthesis